jgi:hypothetical protein
MNLGIRQKLVLLSLLIVVVVSFGFTLVQLHLTRTPRCRRWWATVTSCSRWC